MIIDLDNDTNTWQLIVRERADRWHSINYNFRTTIGGRRYGMSISWNYGDETGFWFDEIRGVPVSIDYVKKMFRLKHVRAK